MFPYQKLEVYKKAFLLNKSVYTLIKGNSSIPTYVKNQLGRASLSIVLNIAEGSAKLTNRDRKSFFVIARGSTFECAAIIDILQSENEVSLTLEMNWILVLMKFPECSMP
ncbi:MAG: ribosomal protein [Cytophagaceae bacterium]|jgi:four helix bundle protein|nr:ribosomal protein [Cytophagaceae bacterium]